MPEIGLFCYKLSEKFYLFNSFTLRRAVPRSTYSSSGEIHHESQFIYILFLLYLNSIAKIDQ
jgi:hypothetical protein